MRPQAEMPLETAGISAVLADIDDTISTDGRPPLASYAALEALAEAGLALALVTGHPAGWRGAIARLWPVDGVAGENGAFYFAYDASVRRMRRRYAANADERAANRRTLSTIRERALREVRGCAISAYQPYRETDLAVDFREDVPLLSAAASIKAIFEEEGATAKISSLHVNGWFRRLDNLSMSRRLAREVLGLESARDRVAYCGDSHNDVLMFGFFPNSRGVANVLDFAGNLEAEPAWIADAGGGGFAEIAATLLSAFVSSEKGKAA